ncbi:hypothetical protein ACFQE5_07620 [Pseudonocardia hispaniensis]|uniref:Uncharacterized protein n=1 Tax=Pseudonocardia hispaniensis TaxID=904933 RepID=A0ABW1J021_9PSEU
MTRPPRAAAFLVRTWWEDGRFRARITYVHDLHAESVPEVQVLTAEPDEVRRRFAAWLEDATRPEAVE